MTKPEVRDLQHKLNAFTRKYLDDVAPLIADGDKGQATNARIRLVKFYLGYVKSRRDASVGASLLFRLRHPKTPTKTQTPAAIARGMRRRGQQHRHAAAARQLAHKVGFGTFDGRTVAAWMIPWLNKSRAAGWKGTVVSGVRTPAYSEHLCYAMCGAPSCPGRCAGRSSNHNMMESQGEPYGALDVSDYQNFGAIQRRIGSPLRNALGAQDPVHFSVTGR